MTIQVRTNNLNKLGIKSSIFQVKPKDKIDLLRMNIEILIKSGKIEEAQASINKLIGDLQDSNMEDEILILNSELALKEENLKKAVNLLKVIFYMINILIFYI